MVNYIEETILSVVEQAYPNLEYIIIDGGSTDGTVEVIKKYEHQVAYWQSEPDNGMYHAIQKGFDKSTGEIMGWINADDKLHVGSLYILSEIFGSHYEVNWLQGTPSIIDEKNRIVYASPQPEINKLFFYEYKHIKSRKYIQQESTYWRRIAWEKAGAFMNTKYKYAGDFELWIRFFQTEILYNVPALLGAFRINSQGQTSIDHYEGYVEETRRILMEYPLSDGDLQKLKNARRFRYFEQKLINLLSKVGKKWELAPTVLNNTIQFDFKKQRFI